MYKARAAKTCVIEVGLDSLLAGGHWLPRRQSKEDGTPSEPPALVMIASDCLQKTG